MGMPCVPAAMAAELIDNTNCISLQTINLEELSLAQFQTLITVPFSEILVIDEASQLKQVLPSTSFMVTDLPGSGDNSQLVNNNNLVVYVPPELTAAANEEALLAQQWYEDSVVATQAMDFLSQDLSQTSEDTESEKMADSCAMVVEDLSGN